MFLVFYNVSGTVTMHVLHLSLHANRSERHIQAEEGGCPTLTPREERKDKVVAVIRHNGGQLVFTFTGSRNPCEQRSPRRLTLMDASISIRVEFQQGTVHFHTPSCMLMLRCVWGEVKLLLVYSYF